MKTLRLKSLKDLDQEDNEQILFVDHVKQQYKWIKIGCIPNGGYRPKKTANKLKRMGTSPGIPDLLLIVSVHTVWFEMKKRKGGVLSKDQIFWHGVLRAAGHTVFVPNGYDEAISMLTGFLANKQL